METLINCDIIVNIESIDRIQGENQCYEVYFTTVDKMKYKVVFDFVWDFRCSIENAFIDRSSKFCHNEKEKSSILVIQDSNYIKYFEEQVSGTRPTEELKNYILFDAIDTVIELLSLKNPELIQM